MAAQDVLQTIRSKVKHKPDSFTNDQLGSNAAANELKEEYEIRKRIQLGRWRDRQRRMSKLKQGVSFDSSYSDSRPGTGRLEGTESPLTSRSHVLSEDSPSSKHMPDTISPTRSEKEKRERIRNRWKINNGKLPSIASVMDQYRERLKAERESGLDLLETIRVLRGISKEEFYNDDEMEIDADEKEVQANTINDESKKNDNKSKKNDDKIKKKKRVKIKNGGKELNKNRSAPVLPKSLSKKDQNSSEIMEDGNEKEKLKPLFQTGENDQTTDEIKKVGTDSGILKPLSKQVNTITEESNKNGDNIKKKKRVKIKNGVDVFNINSPGPVVPKSVCKKDQSSSEIMEDSNENEEIKPLFETDETDQHSSGLMKDDTDNKKLKTSSQTGEHDQASIEIMKNGTDNKIVKPIIETGENDQNSSEKIKDGTDNNILKPLSQTREHDQNSSEIIKDGTDSKILKPLSQTREHDQASIEIMKNGTDNKIVKPIIETGENDQNSSEILQNGTDNKILKPLSQTREHDQNSSEIMEDGTDNEIVKPIFETGENNTSAQETETESTDSEPEIEISVRVKLEFPNEKDDNVTFNPVRRKSSHHIGCRIDSRWPEGHRLHTKPISEPDLSIGSSSKDNLVQTLGEGIATMLSVYKGNKSYSYSDSERKILPLTNNKNSKVRELFEDWRTKMMKVAYDEEFATKHKVNKRFSYPVLPSLTCPPKETKLSPAKETRSIPESLIKPKFSLSTISKHWNRLNKKHVSKRNKHKSINHTKDDNAIPETIRENTSLSQTKSNQNKKKPTYLPEYSSFYGNVEMKQNKNHVINNSLDDKNVMSLNRNSPSTDSAINEPNSDSDNEQGDNMMMIQLPPISVQVKGMYKLPEDEDQQNSSPKNKKQARSKSLIGVQQLLEKEPNRNESIKKLFDTLQENRPETEHRKKRGSKRKKQKHPSDENKSEDKEKLIKEKSDHENNEKDNVKQKHRKKQQIKKSDRELTEFLKIEDRDGQLHVESEARDPVTLISMSESENKT